MQRVVRATGMARPTGSVLVALLLIACSSSATPTPPVSSAPTQAATAAPASQAGTAPPSAASVAPASASPATGSVTGTWSGTWKRDAPLTGGGTLTLHLQQNGSSVTGDITAQGSLCLTSPGIPLTGTFNDPTLIFKVTGDNLEIDYTATLSDSKLSGKLDAVKCPAGVATGTFDLARS